MNNHPLPLDQGPLTTMPLPSLPPDHQGLQTHLIILGDITPEMTPQDPDPDPDPNTTQVTNNTRLSRTCLSKDLNTDVSSAMKEDITKGNAESTTSTNRTNTETTETQAMAPQGAQAMTDIRVITDNTTTTDVRSTSVTLTQLRDRRLERRPRKTTKH